MSFGKKSSTPAPTPTAVTTPAQPKQADQPIQRMAAMQQQRANESASPQLLSGTTPESEEEIKKRQQASLMMG